METKYYKINVEDLFSLDCYGIKRDFDSPAHIKNIFRLDDLYKIRYPLLMQKVANLQYMNFRTKENRDISKREKALYNVPNYFLVVETFPNGYFEYAELLTGISFLIPSEFYDKLYNKTFDLRQEITREELIDLFNDDYIGNICCLFNIPYDKEKKEIEKHQIIKKLTLPKNTNNKQGESYE